MLGSANFRTLCIYRIISYAHHYSSTSNGGNLRGLLSIRMHKFNSVSTHLGPLISKLNSWKEDETLLRY